MKNIIGFLTLFLIPTGIFLNVVESFYYYELEEELRFLEKKKNQLIQENELSINYKATMSSAIQIKTVIEEEGLILKDSTKIKVLNIESY